MIDVLIVVSGKKSGPYLRGLAGALGRAQCSWSVFLTNDAVQLVREPWFADAVKDSSETVMCSDSWSTHQALNLLPDDSPVIMGSQTNHSSMVGNANRVVSL